MKFERLKDENTDTVTGIQVGYSIKRSNANAEDYKSEKYNELKIILDEWIKETGDNLPINLTKDWYQREQEPYNESSLLKTEYHGIRGEMPGKLTNAINNNNKGPF